MTSEIFSINDDEEKKESSGRDRNFEIFVAAALDRCNGEDDGEAVGPNDECVVGTNNCQNKESKKANHLKNETDDDEKKSHSMDISRDLRCNYSNYDGNVDRGYEDDSTSCSSASEFSSSDSDGKAEDEVEENEDSAFDPSLSEYERLRLRNIQRNEARLARLGLLVPSSATGAEVVTGYDQSGSATSSLANVATGMTSSLSTLINIGTGDLSGGKRPRKYRKDKTVKMTKRRSQPGRRAKRKSRKNIRYSKSGLWVQKSYFKFDLDATVLDGKSISEGHDGGSDEDNDGCSCGSEESSIPSPVALKKILRPICSFPPLTSRDIGESNDKQNLGTEGENNSVQYSAAIAPLDAAPHSNSYQCSSTENIRNTSFPSFEDTAVLPSAPKRRSRGRPRRDEYILTCDEKCFHCGGDWNQDPSTIGSGSNCARIECDEECTELLRCKHCQKAFHLYCMLNHGRVSVDEEMKGDKVGGSGYDDLKVEHTHLGIRYQNKSTSASSSESESSQNDMNNTRSSQNDIFDRIKNIPKRCFSCQRQHILKMEQEAGSADPLKRNKRRLNESILPSNASKKGELIFVNIILLVSFATISFL